MRHVPEDELHAYLDQALSRSQCVEIETHLAGCARCRDRRDDTAAIRDRTTALLNRMTPRALIIPPPFDSLADRHPMVTRAQIWARRGRRAGLLAAGLLTAVAAGWGGRSLLDSRELGPAPLSNLASLSLAAPAPADPVADFHPESSPIPIQEKTPRLRVTVPAAEPRRVENILPAPVNMQLASMSLSGGTTVANTAVPATRLEAGSPFDRIWRSVQWEEALQIAGSGLPFIEGLPVIGVLVHAGTYGERPMVIVAQQDPGGDIIQSIEGPVGKVLEVLQRQAASDIHMSEPARTAPDYVDGPAGIRRANRMMLVTGRLSVDSLNALARVATIR
ncbi:MAG: zf-HC2 domain-containing protein [Gemmatimonadales bacterium]|nr:zf-HC2 domain-containing protein [Gemmatimonadales bacterium]